MMSEKLTAHDLALYLGCEAETPHGIATIVASEIKFGPHREEVLVDSGMLHETAKQTQYLIRQGFDVFGWIDKDLAIKKEAQS